MRKFGLLVVSIILTIMAFSQTASPELVSSAGESFNNTTYQLEWSIGECVTATHIAGDYVLTQGFHQEGYIITTVENLATEINISVYPNPTTEFISVDFSNLVASVRPASVITVTDFSGKVLQTNEVTSDIEQINFSNYSVGTYFITISENNQLLKTFKIIKN